MFHVKTFILAAVILLIAQNAQVRAADFSDPFRNIPDGHHHKKPDYKTLALDIDSILCDKSLASGIDGVTIADARTGNIFYTHSSDTLLVPASNRKLFTAAAALAKLGPNFTERTDILTTPTDASSMSNTGVVSELIIRGGGDALLNADNLSFLAREVSAKGVQHVTGPVIVDDSAFDTGGDPWGDGWQADSLLDYYSPSISALEANEDICTISLHGGANPGDLTNYTVSPVTSYFTVDDRVTTGAVGSAVNFTLTRSLTGTAIIATGTIPPNSSPDPTDDDTDGRITLPNPALYAAALFMDSLRANGVKIDGPAILGRTPPASDVIASYISEPLQTVLGEMLKPSDNLVAECLTRLESLTPTAPSTYEKGASVEDEWLKSIGIGPDTHVFADGSGESRCDFVTSRAVVELLLAMTNRKDFPVFYNALSIVGVDGTAKDRMSGTYASGGNAHVKTGTVRNCRSLSGYVSDRGGDVFVFSILMNNHLLSAHELGAFQDKIVERLAEEN